MSIKDHLKAAYTGAKKAHRDIEISKLFFEEHDNHPTDEIANRFFTTIGTDLVYGSLEHRYYMRLITKFKNQWAAAHPDAAPDSWKPGYKGPEVSVTVVEFPLDGSVTATGNPVIDAILAAALADQRRGRRANELAGKCLGCGGTLTADNGCSGEGEVEGYDASEDTSIDLWGIIQQIKDEEEQN